MLAVKLTDSGYFASQCQTKHDCPVNSLFIEYWQCTRHAQADGTRCGIRRLPEMISRTGTEQSAFGLKLNVYFQSDYGFILHIRIYVSELFYANR